MYIFKATSQFCIFSTTDAPLELQVRTFQFSAKDKELLSTFADPVVA